MANIDITSGYYDDPNRSFQGQRCFNLRPYRTMNSGASAQDVLLRPNGWENIDLSSANTKGCINVNGDLYYIFGTALKKITKDHISVPVVVGTFPPGSFSIYATDFRMATNGKVIAFIDPALDECTITFFDIEFSTFSTISVASTPVDPQALIVKDLITSVGGSLFDLEYIDGYFIFCGPTGLFSSSLETVDKGRQFNVLNYTNLTYKADETRAIIRYRNRLYAFGSESTQVFSNAGLPNFPLAEIKGAAMDFGVLRAQSVMQYGQSIYMLGRPHGGAFGLYEFNGSFKKISTDVIDFRLGRMIAATKTGSAIYGGPEEPFKDISQVLWGYGYKGNVYIGVNVFAGGLWNSEGATFCYDVGQSALFGSPKWHERGGYSSSGFQLHMGFSFFSFLDRYRDSITVGVGIPPSNGTAFPAGKTMLVSPSSRSTSGFADFGVFYMTQFFTTQWISDGVGDVDIPEVKITFAKEFDESFSNYAYESEDGETFYEVGRDTGLAENPYDLDYFQLGRSSMRKIIRFSNSEFSGSYPLGAVSLMNYIPLKVTAKVEISSDA